MEAVRPNGVPYPPLISVGSHDTLGRFKEENKERIGRGHFLLDIANVIC